LQFLKTSLGVHEPSVSIDSLIINPKNIAVQVEFCWEFIFNSTIKRIHYDSAISTSHRKFFTGLAGLLQWVQEHTVHRYPAVKVVDFSQSFDDGLALCALVEDFCPSDLVFDDLTFVRTKDNVTKAMQVAERLFDVPRLLDPNDFGRGSLFGQEIIVYLSVCFVKMKMKPTE